VVKIFLAKQGVVEISHPPYSPDLSPADIFLFATVKTALKERGFRTLKTLKKRDGRTEHCSFGGLC
jgi:hypothetical protein